VILSTYTRKDSPWIWLQFATGPGEKKQYRKTAIRKDDSHRKRKIATALRDLEAELLASGAGTTDSKDGWGWVERYLRGRYSSADSAETLKVYLKQWRPLHEYMEDSEIVAPAMFERGHAYEYLDWRCSQVKEKSGKNVSHNTARGEIKLLGLILDEAVERKFLAKNPARRLGIKPDDPALKPEITKAEELVIRQALADEHAWMQLAFHIGISTGLRRQDCRIARAAVRWESDDILIEKPKGGRAREFAIPIYEKIRGELNELRDSGRPFLFDIPEEVWSPSMAWRKFFDRLGMPHLCFHCTRVTFITRGMRAGIPETVMMKMVNHGSKLISRIYQRWTAADVREWARKME